jgi:hypothetical protein
MTTALALLNWTPLKTTALNANAPGSNALNPLFAQIAAYINIANLAVNINTVPIFPTELTNTVLHAN